MTDLPLLNGRQDEYLRYLGFRRNPFPVAPDVEHLFLPPRTDTLLTEILHGIYTRKGFMVITGEVGLGKTTLSQHILNILEEDGEVETALVLNTFLQGTELLGEIIRDFGIETTESSHQGLIMVLNHFLIERYQAGRNCALIIDDAQNLSVESLELVRMISNLETNASKLVQILLVGQPEFQDKLETHSLRQLKSRIMIHATVEPLDRDALRQYVFFKMSAAGNSGGVIVPESCVGLMHQLTHGNPRLVNRLMDRALYGLFAYNTTRVTHSLLKEVAAEMALLAPKTPWWSHSGRIFMAAFAIIGLLNVLLTGQQWLFKRVDTGSLHQPREVYDVPNERQPSPLATRMTSLPHAQNVPPPQEGSDTERPQERISLEQQQARIHAEEPPQAPIQSERLPAVVHASPPSPPRTLHDHSSNLPTNLPKFSEQAAISPALSAVQQFLAYYDLEAYAIEFTEGLTGGLAWVAQHIWEKHGYRLIQLPIRTTGIQGRFRMLRHTTSDDQEVRLLFWRPNYWIDTFEVGKKSETILALQQQLREVSFYHASPDGIVGTQTIASLMRFQKRHRLPVTGEPDDGTLFLLNQMVGDFQWSIQIASLQRLEDASALINALSRKGFKSFVESVQTQNGQSWQTVRVGPLDSYADAEAQQRDIMNKLKLMGRIIQSRPVDSTITRG